MTAIRTILIAAVGLALAAPSAAHAQKKKRPKEPTKEQREKIRQKIRAMREWKLTEALELDSDTADKLFPILDGFDEKFVKEMRHGRKLRQQLRKQVESSKPDDKKLDKLVDQMLDNQRAIWELNEKRFEAARKVLSAEQAAKALIVLPQIDHAIRREMHRAIEGRRRPFRGGEGPPPPPEFDDPF